MKRTTLLVSATSAATAIMLTMTPGTAGAVIHEQVAAYCSGGGHGAINDLGELEPPGISDMTKKNFASPVLHNGVVVFDAVTGLPVVSDRQPAKFPAGTSAITGANVETTDPDHPSAHCNALQP